MVSEADIRQHIADLRWMLGQPCVCKTKRLREACQLDRERTQHAAAALLWAVGENSDYGFLAFALTICRQRNHHPTCNNASLAQAYRR